MSDKKDKQNIDDNLIKGHEYDGIKELDNPLPRWWLVTFWGTIIFAVGYYGYYEMGGGPSLKQELDSQLAQYQAQKKVVTEVSGAVDFQAIKNDATAMTRAKANFSAKCVACHGANGEGLIGPNFTDKHWIHGAGYEDIQKAIRDGVLEKAMPAWKGLIPDPEINELVVYVRSLHGTFAQNGKPAQGIEINE